MGSKLQPWPCHEVWSIIPMKGLFVCRIQDTVASSAVQSLGPQVEEQAEKRQRKQTKRSNVRLVFAYVTCTC